MGLAGHSLSPLRPGQDGTGERWVCINKAPVASGGEGLAVQYPADLAWEGITCHVLDQRTLKMKQACPPAAPCACAPGSPARHPVSEAGLLAWRRRAGAACRAPRGTPQAGALRCTRVGRVGTRAGPAAPGSA